MARSDASYSPAPWSLHGVGGSHMLVRGADGDTIAGLAGRTGDRLPSEQVANGHLLKAAPISHELLDELARTVFGDDLSGCDCPFNKLSPDAYDELRARVMMALQHGLGHFDAPAPSRFVR